MKQRFSALDIRATVYNLKERIVGLRLQNIYDINSKTYLLKFSKPDRKELLLIESGIRIHTTQFSRDKSNAPSMFCLRIRKYLKSRRLTDVRQLGVDRIIDFEFGAVGDGITYHIIAEFYASGNIIVTDNEYRILALLRIVQPKENERMVVGQIYNVNATARMQDPVSIKRLQEIFDTTESKETKEQLKKFLNAKLNYGQALTEHALRVSKLDPNMKVGTIIDKSSSSPSEASPYLTALEAGFAEADKIIEDCANKTQKGYIILLQHVETFKNPKDNDDDGEKTQQEDLVTYNEFHPFLFEQHKTKIYKEFDSFDLAVDEYYSSLESQKLILKQRNQEHAAKEKLDAIKKEQYSRVESLQNAQISNIKKAKLIESNIELVDQAILIIRNAIASSFDWKDLENLVAEEKKRDNPIANVIAGFKLEVNMITLLLSENTQLNDDTFYDSSDDDFEKEDSSVNKIHEKVDVDIYLSAFANARKYYDVKKQSAIKQEKTLAVADKAFKSAEQKIRQDLKESKITISINKIRKPFWFEKFLWFISSENYLVIAGHDAQQNEILVRRHLKKGDVYVHADLHGAASVIVKNNKEGQQIPPSTLYQAGVMSVCQSKAWDAKIVISAYWVDADQVSKTAPTGEYLTTGSFMIRGKKNFLPPVQLIYGFGLLFRLDEQSIPSHLNERRPLFVEDNFLQKTDINGITWDKYNLDEYGVDQDDIIDFNYNNSPQKKQENEEKTKKHVSAKERKLLKKQKQGTNLENSDNSIVVENFNIANESKGKTQKNQTTQNKSSVQLPRGKKGKLKKLKEKYADQDEEERLLRMELLGEIENKEQIAENGNLVGNKDDGEDDADEIKNRESTENLDKLTGSPLPDDILLFAIPVCAPYIALQKYKYKVKLKPGSMKTGKAINFFQNDSNITPHEKELIKCIPDTEMLSVMLGTYQRIYSQAKHYQQWK
ncbi:14311_t:CDS:10 [Entrophospora sp. SA101]|nr:14311_t:CDS:10 [Entrophospora sp. SA101]